MNREDIARIIDPAAFLFNRGELDAKVHPHPHDAAYAKADQIIALSAGGGEATLAEREASVMQDWRWGNLTKLGVANFLRRAGFKPEIAVEKANALSPPTDTTARDADQ